MTDQPAPNAPAELQKRSLLPLKVLFIAFGIVVAVLVIVLVIFNSQRAARNAPIEIEMFPNLALVSEVKADNNDVRYFTSESAIDEVFNFYAGRLGALAFRSGGELGEDVIRGCRKIYQDEPPRDELGRYFVRCFVDNSQSDVTQRLLMTITYDLEERKTHLEVRREWGS